MTTLAWTMPAPQKAPQMKAGHLKEPRTGLQRMVTHPKELQRGPQMTRQRLSGLGHTADTKQRPVHACSDQGSRRDGWRQWNWRSRARPVQCCTTQELCGCMLDYYVLDMCLTFVAGPGARSQCLLKVGVLPQTYLHPAGCGKCVSIDSKHTAAAYLACSTHHCGQMRSLSPA